MPELPYNVMVKQSDKVKTNWQQNPASLEGIIRVQEREQVQATDIHTLQGGMWGEAELPYLTPRSWQYGNT